MGSSIPVSLRERMGSFADRLQGTEHVLKRILGGRKVTNRIDERQVKINRDAVNILRADASADGASLSQIPVNTSICYTTTPSTCQL